MKDLDFKDIQESLDQFQNLFEHSPGAIFIHDFKTITQVNKAFLDLHGYKRKEDIIGKPAMETTIFHEDHVIVKEVRSRLEKENVVFIPLVRHLNKDGKIFSTEAHVSKLMINGVPHIQIIARDISERLILEKQIEESEKKFKDIFYSMMDLFIRVNNDGYVEVASPSIYEILGYRAKDVLGKKAENYYERLEDRHELMRLIKEDGFCQNFEVPIITKSGQRKTLSVNAKAYLDEKGNTLGIESISRDITEKKRIEQRNSIVNVVSSYINDNLSIEVFCENIFRELQQLKPFPDIYISTYDELTDAVSIFFLVENGKIKKNLPAPRVAGKGLSEHIIRTKKGLNLNEEELVAFHKKNDLKIYGVQARSWIGVPLISEDKVLGVLACQSFSNVSYDSYDSDLLSFMGTQIGSQIERSRADKEIRQFEKYFSVSMDLLCIANTDGYFKKMNPKFFEVLGYSEEELLSKSFMEFIHPDDVEATVKEVVKLSTGIPTVNFTNRYQCKNGLYKWLLWSSAVDPESGQIYAAAKDISEQKKSEEILMAVTNIQDLFIGNASLKECFDKMLSLLLNVTQSEYGFIGEVLYDKNNPYLKTHSITDISWNKETAQFFKENAPKGLEFKNLKTLFGRVMTTGEPVIANDPYNDPRRGGLPPGHSRMDCFMGLPFFKNRELVGMVGIANKPDGYSEKDVELLTPLLATCSTLIIAYQNEVKKQSAEKEVNKLADIVSHSSDAIISTDQNGLVVSWNAGAEKLLGYSSKEIIGRPVSKLGPKELQEAHNKMMKKILNGGSIESYETLQLKKGNIPTHVNMSIFPLIDAEGNVKGISSILRDISEQKEAQMMMEQFTKNLEIKVSERTRDLEIIQRELALSLEKEKELSLLKSRFVSTASHQFRTPLAVIQSNMGVLDMQKDQMGNQLRLSFEKVFGRIKGQIDRMTNLMNEVLLLGKINSGTLVPAFESTNLKALCSEIIKDHNEIQNDGRKMKFSSIGKVFLVPLDIKLIDHAISNIVSNAFKYSIGKKELLTTIEFRENKVKISIKDNGFGIPETDLPHLFEPFYRASNVGDISGTGFGLVIAKEYIELNKGNIRVKSKINDGSEFIITFKQ